MREVVLFACKLSDGSSIVVRREQHNIGSGSSIGPFVNGIVNPYINGRLSNRDEIENRLRQAHLSIEPIFKIDREIYA